MTVTDALLALQASVGKLELSSDSFVQADVNRDNALTVTDALLILQKSVGKIDKFPIEK